MEKQHDEKPTEDVSPQEEATAARTEPREGWNNRKAADKKRGRYGAGWGR